MLERSIAIEALTLAKEARSVLDDKKAENIIVLNVKGLSSVTDFYVIATGNNGPHLKALFSELEKKLLKEKVKAYRKAGTPDSGWIVVDYMDVVIHLFSEDAREFYALETLWKDAKRVK